MQVDLYLEEIARSLADVGVRGNKFYLAASSDYLPDSFAEDRTLPGVKGISSSRSIWREWSPDHGRDILFVLPAEETLRLNKLVRVDYDSVSKLLANNAAAVKRVMPVSNFLSSALKSVSRDGNLGTDSINDVINKTITILEEFASFGSLSPNTRLPIDRMDVESLRATATGHLSIGNIDEVANLFRQAGLAATSYGKGTAKFFVRQNKRKWRPALEDALLKAIGIYKSEAEWRNLSAALVVPKTASVIYALDAIYMKRPDPLPLTWSDWREAAFKKHEDNIATLRKSGLSVTIVDRAKVNQSLQSSTARDRERRRRDTNESAAIKPFGKPSAKTKFGSVRYNASQLPPAAMRELVAITPDGKTRIFSSVYGDDQIDRALTDAMGLTMAEALKAGHILINNSTVRMPIVMQVTGYDMTVRQLKPFREVIARYKPNLAFFFARSFNPEDKSFTDLGQYRTLFGVEMAMRGG